MKFRFFFIPSMGKKASIKRSKWQATKKHHKYRQIYQIDSNITKYHKPNMCDSLPPTPTSNITFNSPLTSALLNHPQAARAQGGAGVTSKSRLWAHEDRDEGARALQKLGAHVLSDGRHLGAKDGCLKMWSGALNVYRYLYIYIYLAAG